MEAIKIVQVVAYRLLLAGSLFGVVRAVSAAFSARVRASIAHHPIIHGVWFVIALVVICDLLVRISASIGPRPSPNHSVEPTGGSRFGQTTFVSHWRLPPVAHAERWPRWCP